MLCVKHAKHKGTSPTNHLCSQQLIMLEDTRHLKCSTQTQTLRRQAKARQAQITLISRFHSSTNKCTVSALITGKHSPSTKLLRYIIKGNIFGLPGTICLHPITLPPVRQTCQQTSALPWSVVEPIHALGAQVFEQTFL